MRNVIAGLLLLMGCAPQYRDAPERAGPPPDNYRQIAATYIRANFFDPYSIRDVSLSQPIIGRMFNEQGWIVCIRANAKNRMGAYTGLKDTAILIHGGRVIDSDSTASAVCGRQTFAPAPDIERGEIPRAPDDTERSKPNRPRR